MSQNRSLVLALSILLVSCPSADEKEKRIEEYNNIAGKVCPEGYSHWQVGYTVDQGFGSALNWYLQVICKDGTIRTWKINR